MSGAHRSRAGPTTSKINKQIKYIHTPEIRKILKCSEQQITANQNIPHALTGSAQWAGHRPANRKVALPFPVRAHAWVVARSLVGGIREATD